MYDRPRLSRPSQSYHRVIFINFRGPEALTKELNRNNLIPETPLDCESQAKLALMSGSGGQTLQKAFVPLPGQATAVYTSSGLVHYRHSDWLGSARLTSSPSRTVLSTAAYAPFGETYSQTGPPISPSPARIRIPFPATMTFSTAN